RSLLLWHFQGPAHGGAALARGAEPVTPTPVPGVCALQSRQEGIPLLASLFEAPGPVLLFFGRQPHPGQPAFDPPMDEGLQGTLPDPQVLAAEAAFQVRLQALAERVPLVPERRPLLVQAERLVDRVTEGALEDERLLDLGGGVLGLAHDAVRGLAR